LPSPTWLLGPVVWANQVFDRGTDRLGATGRWLRGSRGRSLLGWVGLGLLGLALGWQALAWMGWGW
jgi:hypothetical protein